MAPSRHGYPDARDRPVPPRQASDLWRPWEGLDVRYIGAGVQAAVVGELSAIQLFHQSTQVILMLVESILAVSTTGHEVEVRRVSSMLPTLDQHWRSMTAGQPLGYGQVRTGSRVAAVGDRFARFTVADSFIPSQVAIEAEVEEGEAIEVISVTANLALRVTFRGRERPG